MVKSMKKVFLKIRRGFSWLFGLIFRIFRIKENRIYFISNKGLFSCNPKAFFEYLYNNHRDEFDFYFCLNKERYIGDGVKQAKFKTIKDYYYFYTSKYIISNQRIDKRYKKRKGQIYIQTWHGGPIPMKAVEGGIFNADKSYIKGAKKESRGITAFTVGSDDILSYYKKSFFFSGRFLNFGTPRYDTIINASEEDCKKAKRALGLPLDKEVVLLAPTFKDDQNIKRDLLDNKKIINFFNAIDLLNNNADERQNPRIHEVKYPSRRIASLDVRQTSTNCARYYFNQANNITYWSRVHSLGLNYLNFDGSARYGKTGMLYADRTRLFSIFK